MRTTSTPIPPPPRGTNIPAQEVGLRARPLRLMGVDFGFARIGIAVVDAGHAFPRPKPPISAAGALKKDARALYDAAAQEEADAIVLGLPLEPDGAAGRMARIVRQLAGHIEALGRPVYLVDERLTSIEAEDALRQEPLRASERDRRRDGEAACRILERFLAAGGQTSQ